DGNPPLGAPTNRPWTLLNSAASSANAAGGATATVEPRPWRESQTATTRAATAESPVSAPTAANARDASASPSGRPEGNSPQPAAGATAAGSPSQSAQETRPARTEAPTAPPNVRVAQAPKKSISTIEPLGDGANGFQIFVKDEDIRQVLALLGEAGKLNILPSPLVTGNVSLSLANVSIDEALDAILRSKGLTARREGRFIYVGTPEEFLAQDKRKDRIA